MCKTVIAEFAIKIKNNDVENIISKEYKRAGIWALFAKDRQGKRVCLEVAKTINIRDEITNAIFILSTKDDLKCEQCVNTYDSRQRNKEYSHKFKVHTCKLCEYVSNLRKKSWKRNPRYIDKYRDMLLHYTNFQFVLVDMDNTMEDNNIRSKKEKEYAETNKALYWYG